MLRYFPEPTASEKDIREKTAALMRERVAPHVAADDRAARFRREAYEAIAREGLAAVPTPQAYGGLGLGAESYYAAIEEIAYVSLSMAVTVGVNNLPQGALLAFGTDAQKRTFLPPLTRGEQIGAFSLSEPGSGSDAASLKTSAKRVEGGYVLNGTKCWCSTAGEAALYLVMARTGPDKTRGISAFLVPAGTQGFRIGKLEEKLGLRSSPLGELVFEDCFVPESQRLGAEGDGLKVALSQLDGGRVVIGAASIGVARAALDRAWKIVIEDGEAADPGAANRLAGHFASIQAMRTLISLAAARKNTGEPLTTVAAQLKLLASDLAMRVTLDAATIAGVRACRSGEDLDRYWRDAKALQIVEGTNQIQRLVLAREMRGMVT